MVPRIVAEFPFHQFRRFVSVPPISPELVDQKTRNSLFLFGFMSGPRIVAELVDQKSPEKVEQYKLEQDQRFDTSTNSGGPRILLSPEKVEQKYSIKSTV